MPEMVRIGAISLTSAVCTIVDLAPRRGARGVERMVAEADRLDLLDPEYLRAALDAYRGRRGVAIVRRVLDRLTFRTTDSELERRFLAIVARIAMPLPVTRAEVNGFRVDFYWPDLGLVVETDGLRYHRTPAQQARDRLRDQAHARAGLTTLRFTHAQVFHEPQEVAHTLLTVASRLSRANRRLPGP
jgi:very-short-patch-repair endonuclease